LDAFRRQVVPPGELLVADDGSGEATVSLIKRLLATMPFPTRHVWHPDAGFRKNAILNKCLAMVTGDYVVVTDADCIPHPRYIQDHAHLAERGCWVQGRRCYLDAMASAEVQPGRPVPALRYLLTGHLSGVAKAFRFPVPVVRRNTGQRGIIGCNMAMWRDDLLAINGWDEAYEGWGIGEDSDVGTRLYHLGRIRKFVYGRAVQYHLDHPLLSRDHLPGTLRRFQETLDTRRVRCERGVSQYLP
jgi:glycosyltransferase involved in cell wall biosynthesis